MVNYAKNKSHKLLIVLALDTGARRSEICALRWSDIDFDTRMVSITKSLKVCEGVIDEKTTKTESSIRTIKISESTINVLLEYILRLAIIICLLSFFSICSFLSC